MQSLIHMPAELAATSLTELFERQAARTPGATALIENGRRVTYEWLDRQTNGVARALRERGVTAGTRVAVHVDVSADTFACVLGVSKAGGVWIPVDTALPTTRQRDILADCEPALQVAPRHDVAPELVQAPRLVLSDCPPTYDDGDAGEPATRERLMASDAFEVCCILYTSGQTGTPKGVVIPTIAVVNHLLWMQASYPLEPTDVAVVYRPCSIVAALWDHFGPLFQGVPSVVVPSAGVPDPALILKHAIQYGASHISGSASFWLAMLSQPRERLSQWRTLRFALTSGEQISVQLVRDWKCAFPQARLLNVYGATECVRPSAYDTSTLSDDAIRVPIGKPVANVSITVRDDAGQPVAEGTIGEVCVVGPCVAHGYLNRPELTRGRFVREEQTADMMFKTGDLGRWRPDGDLEITGRMDDLVKIRGYRVELGEVATLLLELEDVREAAVVCHDAGDGDMRLVAYVVPRAGQIRSARDIRRHLRERLPEYMLPATFVTLDAMPLTASGKIDREALRRGQIEQARTMTGDAALTPTVDRLRLMVAAALAIPEVAADNNFLELGGHSLMAIQIVARVFDEFHVDLPLHVFLSPDLTIRTLATEIDALLRVTPPSTR